MSTCFDLTQKVTQLQVSAVSEDWAAECPRRFEVVNVSKEFPFVVADLSKVEDFAVSDFAFLEEDLIGEGEARSGAKRSHELTTARLHGIDDVQSRYFRT